MISAIVLAAGLSERMKSKNKLLLPWDGSTVLESTLANIVSAGLQSIVVVTGHEYKSVLPLLATYRVEHVMNENYRLGLTTSIQSGISHSPLDCTGYLICLGDMPLIPADEYKIIVNHFDSQFQLDNKSIVIPSFENHWGNPRVFSSYYKSELLAHQFPDGYKPFIENKEDHLYILDFPTDHILRDIDTMEDYKAMMKRIDL